MRFVHKKERILISKIYTANVNYFWPLESADISEARAEY